LSSDISVLFGLGNGTFTPAYAFATGECPTTIAVADLNEDGRPDVITTNDYALGLTILLSQP